MASKPERRRVSSHDIDELLDRAIELHGQGWEIEKAVFPDWCWRGYSIIMVKRR